MLYDIGGLDNPIESGANDGIKEEFIVLITQVGSVLIITLEV